MVNISLGTLNFNYPHVSEKFNEEKVIKFLNECLSKGVKNIDTAYYYIGVEKILGKSGLMNLFNVSSKANPWLNNDFSLGKFGQLSSQNLKRQLLESKKNLNISKFEIYYLHCWDYETNILETLTAFDNLHKEGHYNRFGVSNISLGQLSEILRLCEKHNLIKPSVYQGMYNVYCRKVEEIFPLLKENNISFVCYNPLAGGLLADTNSIGRFNNNEIYKNIFLKNRQAIIDIKKANLNAKICLKWLKSSEYVDCIIIGASTLDHLKCNLRYIQENDRDLSEQELLRIETLYINSKEYQPDYFY